jgi:Ca-activated chloride channel homolog
MKPFRMFLAVLALAFFVLVRASGLAQQESDDRTLSPYFFVKSDDPTIDQLPLKSTSAEVNITGVIADVTVTQIYKNEGKRPIEAIYIFPASTRAAVYGMKMTIGERTITAKIKKKDEALQEYEQAKKEGKSASLLEQHRPNVFQMNVANIMPGDEIRVELKYNELLVPTERIYEFVYPTVVGPRYSNLKSATAPASERWLENPYLHQAEAPTYTFNISVNLMAGLPIQKITCPSHKVDVRYSGNANAVITLDRSEAKGGNRDFILRYQLAGGKIESGLLLYQGEKENFFLLMLQPPKRVTVAQIPGREYIFIVDVSGSMHGFPIGVSKQLLRNLISNLRPTDQFNVLLFSGGSTLLSEKSLPVNDSNITRAIDVIEHQQGGGGTELLPALGRALALPRSEGFSRTVVIVTDGYVAVEEQVFDLIRNNLGNANMFAFGIGSSVNRHIIEGMAHVGMGEPFVITKPEEAGTKAEAFRRMIQSPLLTKIRRDFDGFNTYEVEPKTIPDMFADRPVIVFGKWRGKTRGTITLSGIAGNKPYQEEIDVSMVKPVPSNAALRYLWARYRIMLLSDYNMLRPSNERIREITDLGIAYNLLTAYTSFVAVDSEVRNKDGKSTTVSQPLPLPEGVSDYAVGGLAVQSRLAAAPVSEPSSPTAKKETAQQVATDRIEKKDKESSVRIEKIVVTGGLSREVVQTVLEKDVEKVLNCTQNQKVTGKLTVKLTLNAEGVVNTVTIISNGTGVKPIEHCIISELKKFRFPAAQDGNSSTATVTLLFL